MQTGKVINEGSGMKYAIMCGGKYQFKKHFSNINGEKLVARTIRLLKEEGITDIVITSNNNEFKQFGVPVLRHTNNFERYNYNDEGSCWVDAFYPFEEPVCYLFGDVLYSPYAINIIANTGTNKVEYFASAPPFNEHYIKGWAEPIAFKVADVQYFRTCVNLVKQWQYQGKFNRIPIAWELWQVIKNTPINHIDYTNYTVINDYTCDIDEPEDLVKIQALIDKGVIK